MSNYSYSKSINVAVKVLVAEILSVMVSWCLVLALASRSLMRILVGLATLLSRLSRSIVIRKASSSKGP